MVGGGDVKSELIPHGHFHFKIIRGEPDMVVQAYSSSTGEAEAGSLRPAWAR